MSLSIGIVGLPNAGKSSLFNALLSRQIAQVASYPFTTVEPHEGVVAVPDEKLSKLSEIVKPEKTTPATVTFIDIAGLVKNANLGEGLGNQFLAKIREVDAIVEVVRGFENEDVPHVHGKIDPKEDIEVVNLELELGGIKKPTIYVLNVNESKLSQKQEGIVVCAKLEMELADLSEEERKEYLKELGVKESGLIRLIKEAYKLLDLITFYTIKGGKEVRAWSLKKGLTAQDAAEKVHTDFAKHFIKAEVIPIDELINLGSWKVAHEQGKIRLEGKDYIVCDGDVIEFKVNA